MKKGGVINGSMPNPSWTNRTKKRRRKGELAKASRKRNR